MSNEPTQDPNAEATPAGAKAKLPMIAMIAVGLAIGGGTGAAFVGPMVAKSMGKTPEAHAEGLDPAEAEAAEPGTVAPVHLMENLVLNPAGSGGSRFLLLSVAIEAGNAAMEADMTVRDAELRDIILTSLGTKTVDQLTEIANREGIKNEVQAAIAARFGKSAVKRLYFPQFVVQ
jgi:flagellar FliL protein